MTSLNIKKILRINSSLHFISIIFENKKIKLISFSM